MKYSLSLNLETPMHDAKDFPGDLPSLFDDLRKKNPDLEILKDIPIEESIFSSIVIQLGGTSNQLSIVVWKGNDYLTSIIRIE